MELKYLLGIGQLGCPVIDQLDQVHDALYCGCQGGVRGLDPELPLFCHDIGR